MAATPQTISTLQGQVHLNEQEAARFLGMTVDGLRTWRKHGRGPRFRKLSARCLRYSKADLEAFVESAPAGGGRAA